MCAGTFEVSRFTDQYRQVSSANIIYELFLFKFLYLTNIVRPYNNNDFNVEKWVIIIEHWNVHISGLLMLYL